MRKVLVLLAVLAAAAVTAGLAIPAEAARVSGLSLSQPTLSRELQAIASSPTFECYVEARQYVDTREVTSSPVGDTPRTWSTSYAAYWADLRVNQLSVVAYVTPRDPSAFSPTALAAARIQLGVSIDDEINEAYTDSQSASQDGLATYSCPAAVASQSQLVGGADILASVPTWFQAEQVQMEAGALGLVALLPNALPQSGPRLASWYRSHAHEFETTCVSYIALTTSGELHAVAARIARGTSFAAAARKYSVATNAKQGGVLGCISPKSAAAYNEVVRTYVETTATGRVTSGRLGTTWYLFEPTRRTPNRFSAIRAAVAEYTTSINGEDAGVLATLIENHAQVSVSSSLGTWEPTEVGGTIVPPTEPPISSITLPAAKTPAT